MVRTRKKKVITDRDIEKKTKLMFFNAWRRTLTKTPLGIATWKKSIHPTILGPRGGTAYICSICGKTFGKEKCEIEHTNCVVDLRLSTDVMSWDFIYERINTTQLTIVCKQCHKIKTNFESAERVRLKRTMKYLVCQKRDGFSLIKAISLLDVKELDTSLWQVIDVKNSLEEANAEADIRRGYKEEIDKEVLNDSIEGAWFCK